MRCCLLVFLWLGMGLHLYLYLNLYHYSKAQVTTRKAQVTTQKAQVTTQKAQATQTSCLFLFAVDISGEAATHISCRPEPELPFDG